MDDGATRDPVRYINALHRAIREGDGSHTQQLLSLVTQHNAAQAGVWDLKEDETILHVAIKMRTSCHVISALMDAHPPLLSASRTNSVLYKGQTVLHIALTVGDSDVIELLLNKAKEMGTGDIIPTILNQGATGTRFENTVMLGELPLSVAALTLNTKLFDTLLIYGAQLDARNSVGDNICHSLIKYAHLYPEKIADLMKMFDHIAKLTINVEESIAPDHDARSFQDESRSNFSHVWFAENNFGFNPLKLAADLGQHALFRFIMELRGIYCHVNSDDGLFDVELYDVTDIDLSEEVHSIKTTEKENRPLSKVFPLDEMISPFGKDHLRPKVPTLEMIIKNDPAIVFKFIQLSPLRYVINRKWRFFRWFYTFWGMVHMAFMIGYTVYAIRRSKMDGNDLQHKIGSDVMVTLYLSISVIFALAYLIQEVIRIIKGHMPWNVGHVMNCYHNGPFRLMLVAFSLTIIADVIWKLADNNYRDYFLICSVILGWWFLVFFLRGIRQFSFFTVMIQKVLVGDMFRFSIIIGMELIAFTTGMLIAFREMTPPEPTVQEFSRLMVQMFKMMFGFTTLDVLFDARQPWLTVCLYVAFVLLTYVLMINSLIAMMSQTCSVISQNRELQYRIQQMSIILFFESIFPTSWIRVVGEPRRCSWFDPDTRKIVPRERLFMEVRSLREVTRSKSRHRMTNETMLETIFNTLKSIQIPSMSDVRKESAGNVVGEEPIRRERADLRTGKKAGDSDEVLRKHRKKKKRKAEKRVREGTDDITGDDLNMDNNRNDNDTAMERPNEFDI